MTKENFLFAVGNELINELVLQLERNGSVDTGALKNSIDLEINGDNLVITMEDYYIFLEYGTRAHDIKPKGKALKFNVDGKDVFAKVVHHPGFAPKPFIRPVIFTKLNSIVQKNMELINVT